MRSKGLAVLLAVYRLALPGYHYEFPRDHFNHPDFQTEWWYYTGNLHTSGGQRFGFELTFFRQGVDRSPPRSSVWDVRDVWMAHLALSDIDGHRFFHTERLNRAGAGLAGADLAQLRVWNGNWRVQWIGQSTQELDAVADNFSFKLTARSEKAPVVHGKNGVSQKAEGEGRASHYISFTRLITTGAIELDGTRYEVEGLSWMDHEFFTHQLDANQAGWDWFSLQLTDESEIMLYRLRRKDGSADLYSAGTYIDPHGTTRFLTATDFSLVPGKIWTSPSTRARYPVEWSIRIPSLGVDAAIATRLPQQEVSSTNSAVPPYWEGAIDAIGTKQGNSLIASGYLEMTGYTGKPPLARLDARIERLERTVETHEKNRSKPLAGWSSRESRSFFNSSRTFARSSRLYEHLWKPPRTAATEVRGTRRSPRRKPIA